MKDLELTLTEHSGLDARGSSCAVAVPQTQSTGDYQVEVDEVSESEWGELLEQFVDANIYQTWAYGSVRWGEQNLSHIILKRGTEVCGMAQLRILRPAGLRAGIAYLTWGPVCQLRNEELVEAETVAALASALRQEYVEKRGLFLEVVPNAFFGSQRARAFESAFARFARGAAFSDGCYRTFLLDLASSMEELRKHFDKKWRNQLNSAERNDLTITESSTVDDYRKFCSLYYEMQQRKNFRTKVSVEEFERIQERLPVAQQMKILICEYENRPAAGAVYSDMGETAIYLLGAAVELGMKVKASYRLQWMIIRNLKERGVRFYDLGGIDPAVNPGVHHFKAGLSGDDISHIAPFTACDNPFSAAIARGGRVLRSGLRRTRVA